jgi:hypothetical protein
MGDIAILIPILALSIPIVALVTRSRNKRYELEMKYQADQGGSADTAQMHAEIRALRERIIVLERVITDSNSSTALDREIEKLR